MDPLHQEGIGGPAHPGSTPNGSEDPTLQRRVLASLGGQRHIHLGLVHACMLVRQFGMSGVQRHADHLRHLLQNAGRPLANGQHRVQRGTGRGLEMQDELPLVERRQELGAQERHARKRHDDQRRDTAKCEPRMTPDSRKQTTVSTLSTRHQWRIRGRKRSAAEQQPGQCWRDGQGHHQRST